MVLGHVGAEKEPVLRPVMLRWLGGHDGEA
jgi:hypothetical protein